MIRKDFDEHYGRKWHDLLFRWVDIRKIRLLKKYIKGEGLVICDLGCGSGRVTSFLTKKHTVFGIDFNPRLLEIAKAGGLRTLNAEIESVPLTDDFFDVVIMIDSIEHIPSREKLGRQLRRILKTDGLLIIFTPSYDSFLWNLGEILANAVTGKESGHITPFTRESLEFFLGQNGFKLELLRRINFTLGIFAMARNSR